VKDKARGGPIKCNKMGWKSIFLRNYGKPHYEKLLKQKKKMPWSVKLISYHKARRKTAFLSRPCLLCGSKIASQKGCWYQKRIYFKLLILTFY
jgi:hypothetical protein